MESPGKLYSPTYIPYFLGISNKYRLTPHESLLYGFIVLYLVLANKDQDRQFYFSTAQLAKLLNCSEDSIKDSFRTLHKNQLIFRHTKFITEINRKRRVITVNMPIILNELNKNNRGKNTPIHRGENYPNNYNIKYNNINKVNFNSPNEEQVTSPDGLPELPF